MSSDARGYYVYTLVDPRDGSTFYVGKGKGRRAWSHAKAEAAGRERNGPKALRLSAIRLAGLEVVVVIVEDGLSEREALALERKLICDDRDGLTNISQGSRSPMECATSAAAADLTRIKPLCVLVREGASPERMAVWARVTAGLGHIASL
jgi:hypothetical protein